MTALSPTTIVQTWESGAGRRPGEQALTMLAGSGAVRGETINALTVGQRDRALLDLRSALYGRWLDCVATCPGCDNPVEFTLDAVELRGAGPGAEHTADHQIHTNGYEIAFRLPTAQDLAVIAATDDESTARKMLIDRCVTTATFDDLPVRARELPREVVDAIGKRIGELDPDAETRLDLTCPHCAHSWSLLFDIVSFLWAELSASAKRLLHEVAALARAYGWRETDILAMSPTRRRVYLELARQ